MKGQVHGNAVGEDCRPAEQRGDGAKEKKSETSRSTGPRKPAAMPLALGRPIDDQKKRRDPKRKGGGKILQQCRR